jgi:hypothetical protein
MKQTTKTILMIRAVAGLLIGCKDNKKTGNNACFFSLSSL